MENQTEKNMENEMETAICIYRDIYIYIYIIWLYRGYGGSSLNSIPFNNPCNTPLYNPLYIPL